jgi:hypothetical protein
VQNGRGVKLIFHLHLSALHSAVCFHGAVLNYVQGQLCLFYYYYYYVYDEEDEEYVQLGYLVGPK